jgi:1-acyl-sn-glycerol-3-phosphate acyltransferase
MTPDAEAAAGTRALVEHPMWKWCVVGTQLLVYPILVLIRLTIVRSRLSRDYIADSTSSRVIYANHQSRLDPFLVCVALSPKDVLKALPYRLFVANYYFKNPFMALGIRLLGGFPAQAHPTLPYGLDQARRLLETNQTIVIFPQGKRTREKIARNGIAVLAQEPDVELVPVSLDWRNRLTCDLKVGAAFEANDIMSPKELMDKVHSLAR